MAQVKLNKSSLSLEQKNLKNYKQFLPSLDLKRQKLLIEKNKGHREFENAKQQLDSMEKYIGHHYPMAADSEFNFNDLLKIESIEINNENIVGVSVPLFGAMKFNTVKYDYFNTPHWLDNFLSDLMKIIEMRVRVQVAQERVLALDKAVQIVTQRKNLFEKVLIPKARTIIRTIQIFLADNERAGVVRSKIAKKKRQIQ
jgi:V/A-type H+/Na+-transporting ATPase subunit D